ncbi:hypothetical protein EYF80_040461 [Liparis tanakae]|uniref:Uncharacterized protein n=1 Tax=Liparis tanakae TaxID=230148 RepID=A0A4Z2G808_9TELE|nr:hypothetical protein EYF80_040461 [Liparis tanakae]
MSSLHYDNMSPRAAAAPPDSAGPGADHIYRSHPPILPVLEMLGKPSGQIWFKHKARGPNPALCIILCGP